MKKYISLVLSIILVLICCAGILPVGAAPDFDVDIKFEKYVTLPELHLPIQSLEAGNVRSLVYFGGENIPEKASLIMGLYEGDKLVEVKAKSVQPQTALFAATDRLEVPAENTSDYKIKAMVLATGNVSPLTKVKTLTSSEKKILSFKVGDIEAEIFDGIGEIVLPEFSTETAPQIEVSPSATVWPASGVDLTDPDGTVYTVTAADGTEAYYTLKIPQQQAWFRRDTNITYTAGQTVPQSNNWQSTTLGSDQSISYMVDSVSGNRYRNITDASTSASTTYEWYCPAGSGRPDSWKFDLKFRFNKTDTDYSANSVFFYLRNSSGKIVEFYGTANDSKIPDIHGFSMYTSQAYPSVPSSVMLEASDKKYMHLEYGNWYNIRISFNKVTDTKGLMTWYITNDSGDYVHSGRFDSVIDASIAAQKVGYFGLTTRALGKSSIDIEYVRLYDHAKHVPVEDTRVALYMVGDSLMQEYVANSSDDLQGWGSPFSREFTSDLRVENTAISGHRAEFYVQGGTNDWGTTYNADWQGIKRKLKEGDYVLISIGVNDTSVDNAQNFITTMIDDALAAGAIPFLVSETPKGGNEYFGTYKELTAMMKALAKEKSIEFFDLGNAMYDKFAAMVTGSETILSISEKYFVGTSKTPADWGHLDGNGAVLASDTLIELLQNSEFGLKAYISQ